MPATLHVPEKPVERKRDQGNYPFAYVILDDREPPPGFEPEPERKAPEVERGVCIIGDDED